MQKNQQFTEAVKNYRNGFHPIVSFNPATDTLMPLNFTEENKELNDTILKNNDLFTQYITEKLRATGATYGVGGYNEHRTIYSRSAVFDTSDEPRRLHLGLDIWGEGGTAVYAPLEGTVHSFAYNDAFGDYGATLILQHELLGVLFHTLYGHLSLHSIADKREGQTVEKGEWIAAFGEAPENGYWPPHLHFQIILDMEGRKGDYPGVCKYSERN
ncbi:MAG TPA: peptidoglycan DD-metalloendopeptidase family protein, partial [Niastella sp.]|nr:peptidoglycan DD-metalloendopeptidase family protein [Niastella sp.]